MSEGGSSSRMKRYGSLLFKNPPQPHMCIQVYMQDNEHVSYINILSWDKVALPSSSYEPTPFYGGMKISASRTDKNISVYAVIAHSEVLRVNGKYAADPKKRSSLIEDILDYVEATNEGVKFMRVYSILKDRDITGELKKIWTAVQLRQDKENEISQQQETWIDAPPQVSQYNQSYNNQDFQQTAQESNQSQQKSYNQPGEYKISLSPDCQSNDNYQGSFKYDRPPIQCFIQDKSTPQMPSYDPLTWHQEIQNLNSNMSFNPTFNYTSVPSNTENTTQPPSNKNTRYVDFPNNVSEQQHQISNSQNYNSPEQQQMSERSLKNESEQWSGMKGYKPMPSLYLENNNVKKKQVQERDQDNPRKELSQLNKNLQITDLDEDEPTKTNSNLHSLGSSKQEAKESKSNIITRDQILYVHKDKSVNNSNDSTIVDGSVKANSDINSLECSNPEIKEPAHKMIIMDKNSSDNKDKSIKNDNGYRTVDEPMKTNTNVNSLECSKQETKDSKLKIVILKKNSPDNKDKSVKTDNDSTIVEGEMARLLINNEEEKKGDGNNLETKNGFVSKLKVSNGPKRAQTTVNNIIKSVFRLPSSSSDENLSLFNRSSKKSNGQLKAEAKGSKNEGMEFRKEDADVVNTDVVQTSAILDSTEVTSTYPVGHL